MYQLKVLQGNICEMAKVKSKIMTSLKNQQLENQSTTQKISLDKWLLNGGFKFVLESNAHPDFEGDIWLKKVRIILA